MSSPAWIPWLIGVLALALAIVSAMAGVLWSRSRALPLWQVAQLARELAERQRALEEILAKLERGTRAAKGSVVEVPARPGLGNLAGESVGTGGECALSPAPAHEGGGGRREKRLQEPFLVREGKEGRRESPVKRPDGGHVTPPSPTLIAVPDLAVGTAREAVSPQPADELQRRHGAVWELADAGARAEQIAAHLGLPVGHVELILGLRKPMTAGSGGR